MHVPVKICGINDPVAFPEMKDGYLSPCTGFAVLQAGMVSGKTSCAILANDRDGKPIVIEFSGDMFLTLAAALKGARERFGDPWNGV